MAGKLSLTAKTRSLLLWGVENDEKRARDARDAYMGFYRRYIGKNGKVDNDLDMRRFDVLAAARWGSGGRPICPKCNRGSDLERYREDWSWRCRKCHDRGFVSVTSGTRIRKLRLTYHQLIIVVFLFASHPADKISYRHLTTIAGISRDASQRWLALMYGGKGKTRRVLTPGLRRKLTAKVPSAAFKMLLRRLLKPLPVDATGPPARVSPQ